MPTATADKEVRYKDADELIAAINKKHGPGTIVKASAVPVRTRLSTGSLSLDVMMGGGWPTGQFHELVGEFSSGKSALCMQTVAANQKMDPEFLVLWIAAEPYDASWAAQNGIDNDRVHVYETNAMEEAYGVAEAFMKNRAVDLIVIDSLPALIPNEEEEKDMDQLVIGKAAIVNNKFFTRKGATALKRRLDQPERQCTVLCVNQWREKIGVMHGDPRTTNGGKGKDFAYCIRLSVRRTSWIKQSEESMGIEITAVTIKNKSAPQNRIAAVDYYFDGPFKGHFDTAKDMASTAVYMGVVRKAVKSKWYYFGDEKWDGKEAFFDSIREDLDLQRAVRAETIKVLGTVSTDPRVREDD